MTHKKCNTLVKFGTVQYTLECDFDDDVFKMKCNSNQKRNETF